MSGLIEGKDESEYNERRDTNTNIFQVDSDQSMNALTFKEITGVNDETVENVIVRKKTRVTIVEISFDRDEENETQSWENKFLYILTLVGFVVGFGNFWRFPSLVQSNGGAAFLIPYFAMLAILGIPVTILELSVGQRLRKSTLGCWTEISPYLSGIGVVALVINFILGIYYPVLISYCVSYLVDAFRDTLRYTNCDFAVGDEEEFCEHINISNKKPLELTTAGFTTGEACDLCHNGSASRYYWNHVVLNISTGIGDPGYWNWYIALYVLIVWVGTWAILLNGFKAAGNMIYFTVLYFYIMLIIFLIFTMTLEGIGDGYRVLLTPDWSKLLEASVWLTAGSFIFFSLNLGTGTLILFASYMPHKNDCYIDALLVSIIDSASSIFAAIIIFPILGFAGTEKFKECKQQNIPNVTCDLDKFIKGAAGSGASLVFVGIAEIIASLPSPQLWAFLFFLMLFSLGFDSIVGITESGIQVVQDLLKIKKRKLVTSVYCSVSCLSSMIFCLGWGQYVMALCDLYAVDWCLFIVVFFEFIGIAWIYGLKQFSYEFKLMTGHHLNMYLILCWKIISPLIMIILFGSSVYQHFEGGQTYLAWNAKVGETIRVPWPILSIVIGIILAIIVIIWIPLFAILAIFNIYVIKSEVSVFFPEDELRQLYNINSDDDKKTSCNPLESFLYWTLTSLRRGQTLIKPRVVQFNEPPPVQLNILPPVEVNGPILTSLDTLMVDIPPRGEPSQILENDLLTRSESEPEILLNGDLQLQPLPRWWHK